MISTTVIAPFAGTIGGGFFLGFIAGFAIKKAMRLAAIIIGLFIAALAYLDYQGILYIDWNRVETASQNGLAWISNTIKHVSNTIGSPHSGTFSHVGIPLSRQPLLV